MGRESKYPGLRVKGGVWWIDIDSKRHGRIYESTGCRKEQKELAEAAYHQRVNRAFKEQILGVRPRRSFSDAATRHLGDISEPWTQRTLIAGLWSTGRCRTLARWTSAKCMTRP